MQQPPFQPPPRRPRRTFRQWYRAQTRFVKIGLACVALFVAVAACNGLITGITESTAAQPTATPVTSTPTQAIVLAATVTTAPPTSTPQSVHYPPTTLADLRGLAARGVVSAIHEFHSESVGLTGACPQPKREVTVDPSVTGQQLAEDLLAYFYAQQLDSSCGSIVFAYHNQGEANDIYTAGRIKFDVTDSNGTENVDPNASNLTHTLTLDIGGALTGQEYVVTY